MLDNSSFSDSQKAQVNDFRQTMNNLKSPFIQKINITKKMFHKKIENFQQNNLIDLDDQSSQEVQIKQRVLKYRQSQLDTEQNINQKQYLQQIRVSQANSQLNINKKSKNNELPFHFMKEWTASKDLAFSNIQQAKESFINVFHKKLSMKKNNKKERNYDFKEDQKEMLLNIFHQLQYPNDKGFASIDNILQFFEKNELFYLFYNLHPNRLKYQIKQFARTRSDSLSQKQFLLIFYLDRPFLKDLSDPYEKVVNRKCILDSEGWQEMKNIFNTLDTFGNQTIHIYPFFKKLKAYHTNPSLIFSPVIEFPQIDRIYTLKKVVFDLEHKFTFNQKMKWMDIQNLIFNFNHKEEPTLDVIFERDLEKGRILVDSNYFLIEKRIIELLKNIFERCPKFSQFFVNTKFICHEILQNLELKQFYNNFVRQRGTLQGGYINFQEATRFMAAKAPQYIDLDEFLEYYSIKGAVTNILMQKNDEITSTDQDNQEHNEKIKLLRKVRSLQKLQNSRYQKKIKKASKQITHTQQFNLTKKEKETIRQRKVKQMLQQKQEKQLKELRKKFKANPIPADLNPQRLRQEQKRIQMRKRRKFQEIAKRRQQEKQILSYLKANTKLFEPLNKQNQEQRKNANEIALKSPHKSFTYKPVPWFVQQNMLQKIEKEKQQRKKKFFEQARIKYARSWNHLPDFFFKDEEQQKSEEDSLIKVLKKTNQQKPKVIIRANPVPDFKALQQQFEDQLESKKKSFQPTKIQEFNITSPKASRKMHCNFLSPQVKVSHKSDWRKTINSPPQNKISTTKKTEQWMNHNRKIEEQKRFVEQEEKFRQKQRMMKQKNFAKFMSRKLRQQERYMPDLGAQTAEKLKRHKETVQYLQRLTQKQLSQIYGRVLQRPFLFEIGNEQQQMKKSYKAKKKGTKASKKKVIKNIDAIDMSEQSTNKHHQNLAQGVNYGNQYDDDDGQYYEDQENNQYDSNEQSSRKNHGLNQSF